MTLAEAVKIGADRVGRRDAMLLLSHVTSHSEARILIYEHEVLPEPSLMAYLQYLDRRSRNEPLQYIIGKWDFMGLEFRVDSRALIPRPETELLVEEALKFINGRVSECRVHGSDSTSEAPLKVLDVCTGSGCIALAIACLTDAGTTEITAVDISRDALSLAAENAVALKIPPGRVTFIESDLLDRVNGDFDVIISNPPYILSDDMATLSETVLDFEPHLALDGGLDGLDIYRRLMPQCRSFLRPGGALFLEIGPITVVDLLANAGFQDILVFRDYAGLERIVSGRQDRLFPNHQI